MKFSGQWMDDALVILAADGGARIVLATSVPLPRRPIREANVAASPVRLLPRTPRAKLSLIPSMRVRAGLIRDQTTFAHQATDVPIRRAIPDVLTKELLPACTSFGRMATDALTPTLPLPPDRARPTIEWRPK